MIFSASLLDSLTGRTMDRVRTTFETIQSIGWNRTSRFTRDDGHTVGARKRQGHAFTPPVYFEPFVVTIAVLVTEPGIPIPSTNETVALTAATSEWLSMSMKAG